MSFNISCFDIRRNSFNLASRCMRLCYWFFLSIIGLLNANHSVVLDDFEKFSIKL